MQYLGLLLPLVLVVVVLGTPSLAQGQNLGEVFDVDDAYTKALPAGQQVAFVWLAYNRDLADVLLRISVDPGSGNDFSASLAPRFVVLKPGDSVNVTLTVSAAAEPARRAVGLTVTFSLARAVDPSLTQTMVRIATADLEPVPPPLPQENLILGIFPNPLPPPLNTRVATFLISIVLWGLFAGVAILVVTPAVHRFTRRTKTELDEVILTIVRGPLVLLLVTYGVVQSTSILQPPLAVINLLFLLYNVVLVVTLTWMAYRLFRGVVIDFGRRAAEKRDTPLIDTVLPLIGRAGGIIIVLVGFGSLAALFGLDLTAFVVGAGVVGIAIAFAAQESLSNFFSGILLMLDRPFKEGDLVEIDGDRARIEKIGLRSTVVYHRPSHKLLVIPNNKMAREMIINLVRPDLAIRQRTTVGVEYGADVEQVKTILAEAAKENPGVIGDKPEREPYARLEEFGDSALIFKLKFWVRDADKLNRVRGEVNEAIVRRLTEAGIEIPFPRMTVALEEEERSKEGRRREPRRRP